MLPRQRLTRRELLSLGNSAFDADPIVHIASLLVQATGHGIDAVRNVVGELPGAEIHETGRPDKLVVVLESAHGRAIADAASELQQLPGVLTVSIAAHLTDRASSLEGEFDESTTIPQA